MNKIAKRVITFTLGSVVLVSTLTAAIATIVVSQKNKDQNNESSNNPDKNQEDNNEQNEEYPELSAELQKRVYPFEGLNSKYFYMYANIHAFLEQEPAWDELVNYRCLMPDYQNDNFELLIKQDVLYKNLYGWIKNAIFQHWYFKNKTSKLTLEIDYKVNSLEKNILINCLWWFENDYSLNKHLPKRYWDQIIVQISGKI